MVAPSTDTGIPFPAAIHNALPIAPMATPSAHSAGVSVSEGAASSAHHCRNLEEDFQIRLKFGLSFGKVLICKPDITGESWDECCLLGEETAKVGEILVTGAVRDSILENPTLENTEFERVEVPRGEEEEPFIAYKMAPIQ